MFCLIYWKLLHKAEKWPRDARVYNMCHTLTAPLPRACEENTEMATKTKPHDSQWHREVNSKPRKVTKVRGQGHENSSRRPSERLLWKTLHLSLKNQKKKACEIIMGLFEMQNSVLFCYIFQTSISCEIQYWFAPIGTAQQAVVKQHQLGLWESSC